MSTDKRRLLRTQGRFSANSQQSCENKQKECTKETNMQRKVKSDSSEEREEGMTQGSREIDQGTGDLAGQQSICLPEGLMKMTYQENSHYNITAFDLHKKPEEIRERGLRILSTTDIGESRILYYPLFLEMCEAYDLFDKLENNMPWRQMNIMIHGREHRQPRLVAWFGPFPYGYSGVVMKPQEMPDYVLYIKRKMEYFLSEENIDVEFNSVLLNFYRDGSDSVAWHSDDELSMGIHPTIASVSLGQTRRFELRRKPIEADSPVEYFVNLKHGSLLIMDGVMQSDWQHRVPKEPCKTPRINLTFRKVYKNKNRSS